MEKNLIVPNVVYPLIIIEQWFSTQRYAARTALINCSRTTTRFQPPPPSPYITYFFLYSYSLQFLGTKQNQKHSLRRGKMF